jgi:hypothetical protein
MDGTEESRPTHDPQEHTLPENCVEYCLLLIDPKLEAGKKLAQLETIRKSALQHCQSLTKDYIWQRDEFNLELRNEQGLQS